MFLSVFNFCDVFLTLFMMAWQLSEKIVIFSYNPFFTIAVAYDANVFIKLSLAIVLVYLLHEVWAFFIDNCNIIIIQMYFKLGIYLNCIR